MPVIQPREKFHFAMLLENLLHCLNQLLGFFRGYVPSRIINENPILFRYQVAPERHVILPKLYTSSSSLQSAPTHTKTFRVITQHGKNRSVRTRTETIRNSFKETTSPFRCYRVHVRLKRNLQRRFVAQFRNWIIRHSIADDEHILHLLTCSIVMLTSYPTLFLIGNQPLF